MAKLKPIVDSLDDVAEEFREEYTKGEDGKFVLAALTGFVPKEKVEDVTGLKSALKKERDNAAAAAKQLKALQEKFGDINVEEYEQMKAAQAEQAEREAEKKGEWEKLKAQMREQHQTDLAKRETEAQRLKKELERHLVDAQATAAINAAQGNVTLLLPHVKALVKLVEENGVFKPVVTDAAGTPRVNGDGNPISIADLVGEMRTNDVYAGAFKGTDQSGSGAPPNDKGGAGGSGKPNGGGKPPAGGKNRSAMTPKEKVAYIKEHGNEAFMSLPF